MTDTELEALVKKVAAETAERNALADQITLEELRVLVDGGRCTNCKHLSLLHHYAGGLYDCAALDCECDEDGYY